MKIAITGAFSYSGKYITRRLLAQGNEVITLTNHSERGDPFGGKVEARPLNFNARDSITESLHSAVILINTYWVRFDKGQNTQSRAVENTRILIDSAMQAGVKKVIHISITNPSLDSPLPYFSGKAANERTVLDSGLSYTILRPTVLFGKEDILINNIAWILRRFPLMLIPDDGSYRLQPVYVDDLAQLVVEACGKFDNQILDAVGPDIYSFRELVELIGMTIGISRPLVSCPSWMALSAASLIGLFVGDVVLTREEMLGLMANLLVSKATPRCNSRLVDWLQLNKDKVGSKYASELSRHYF